MDDCCLFCKVFETDRIKIFTAENDLTAVGLEVFRHQIKQRGFAAAVRTDKSGDFAFMKIKGQTLDHLVLAVGK